MKSKKSKMKSNLIIRIGSLCLVLIVVIGLIYYLKTKNDGNTVDLSLLKDRNEYISKYNKRICKYNIVEIQMETKTNSIQKKVLKLSEGDWIGRGDASLDLVEKSIDDFCNIKIRDEVNLDRLKAPIHWTEDIEFVFSDQSRIKAQLSKKGIIKIGHRHYFTIHLLELIKHL